MLRTVTGRLAVMLILSACAPATETSQAEQGKSVVAGSGAAIPSVGAAAAAGQSATSSGPFVMRTPSSAAPNGAGAGAGRAALAAPRPTAGAPAGPQRVGAAGSGGSMPASAGTAGLPPSAAMMPVGAPTAPVPDGSAGTPIIPEMTGECPQFMTGNITFMGVAGIAIVAAAKPSAPTAPMVFYWHGTGSSSGEYASMASAVAAGVMREGGVLVSFQSSSGGDLLSGTSVFGAGDFMITDQLVACAVKNHNVDPKRIFTTGCSAGGLFAGAMGAARSNYIAASAPNSGGYTTPGIAQFQGKVAPALMTIHGAPGGDVVIVDFSETSASADMAYKAAGGFVINCNHGGGHCGGGSLAGDMWTFFQAHPYGTRPSPWEGDLPAGFNPSCKIFGM